MKNTLAIRIILWTIGTFLLGVVGVCTHNVLSITNDKVLFSIDFVNKHQIISSYGVLIGAILSFLSIVFLSFNIIQQQSHYENDKIISKEKEDKQLLDRLKLLVALTKEIIENCTQTGSEMKKFYLAELDSPLLGNFMQFISDKSYHRIIELDYLTNYQSFQRYFGKDKESEFINLYKILDFYGDSTKDLQNKMSSYLDKKQKKREVITTEFKNIIDISVEASSAIKREFPEDYLEDDWYKLFNNLVLGYYEHIRNDKYENTETNVSDFKDNLLKEFVERYTQITCPKHNDIIDKGGKMISNLRKDIEALEQYCIQMGNSIKDMHDKYFVSTSDTYVKLETLKDKIETVIIKNSG